MTMNSNNNAESSFQNKRLNLDPQIELEGTYKQKDQRDMITFDMEFWILRLTFIVIVPEEGVMKAPVYVKFKLVQGLISQWFRRVDRTERY